MMLAVFVDDRAMDGIAQFNALRLCAAFDLNVLLLALDGPPGSAVSIFIRVLRIQLLDIEILLVDADDGETPGNPLVMSHGYARKRRLARAEHIETRRNQVPRLAQRRQHHRAM